MDRRSPRYKQRLRAPSETGSLKASAGTPASCTQETEASVIGLPSGLDDVPSPSFQRSKSKGRTAAGKIDASDNIKHTGSAKSCAVLKTYAKVCQSRFEQEKNETRARSGQRFQRVLDNERAQSTSDRRVVCSPDIPPTKVLVPIYESIPLGGSQTLPEPTMATSENARVSVTSLEKKRPTKSSNLLHQAFSRDTTQRMSGLEQIPKQKCFSDPEQRGKKHSSIRGRKRKTFVNKKTDASAIRPLDDIKKWSIDYFQQVDPDLAVEMAWCLEREQSGSDTDISEADTRSLSGASVLRVHERERTTRDQLNTWLDFIGQGREQAGRRERDVAVTMQLSHWDGDLTIPGQEMFESVCWSMGHDVAANIDQWVDINVDLEHKYSVDVKTDSFISGKCRPSGLIENRLVEPPDVLYESLEPDFDPIDWNKIPTVRCKPSKHEPSSPFQARQSSGFCVDIVRDPYLKRVAMAEIEKEKKQKEKAKKAIRSVAKKKAKDPNRAVREDNPWVPIANIYIRPAREDDAAQICRIYNEWVDCSMTTRDAFRLDESFFEEIVAAQRNASLPFLVAAMKSSRNIQDGHRLRIASNVRVRRGMNNDGSKNDHIDRYEKVVGYTFAESMCEQKGEIFRGVVDTKVFVDTHYLNQGIGQTLLDRLLPLLDPWYQSRRGTDFEFDQHTDGAVYRYGTTTATSLKIRQILIDVLFEADDSGEFEWKKAVLQQKFAFRQAALFVNLGERENKRVNVATFAHEV